ncbi:hypothetical protein D3C72_830070 [compost metagenome]
MPTPQDQAIADTFGELHALANRIAGHASAVAAATAPATFALPYLRAVEEECRRALELASRAVELRRKADEAARPATLFDLPAPPAPEPPPDDRSPLPVEPERVTRCRSAECRAEIVYLERAGRPHPVDAGTVRAGEVDFVPKQHTSHFSTCPEADRFRRGRQ